MISTQEHLQIKDIKNDLVILKDGTLAVILQTSAVNFDLLSENEQLAIISSFAGLLNSLSFPIQIMIRSKRLDITSYLKILTEAQSRQTNPLLRQMIERYRVFVETIIRENEVLDKQFYAVVTVSSLELGIGTDIEKNWQKALTILIPRRDHIIRQLGRIGLKATQLNTEALVRLFYDIYNGVSVAPPAIQQPTAPSAALVAGPEETTKEQLAVIARTQPQAIPPQLQPQPQANPLTQTPIGTAPTQIRTNPNQTFSSFRKAATDLNNQQPPQRNTPFVVEELPDDYGTIQ